MPSNNKIAMVTGAGSGVGRACSLALLRAGYTVVLVGRRAEKLQETVDQAGDDAERTLAVPTDIGNPEEVKSLFEKIKQTYGRLDILFNNAGTGSPSVELDEVPFETWQTVVAQFTINGHTAAADGPVGVPVRLGQSHALYNAGDTPLWRCLPTLVPAGSSR